MTGVRDRGLADLFPGLGLRLGSWGLLSRTISTPTCRALNVQVSMDKTIRMLKMIIMLSFAMVLDAGGSGRHICTLI